MHNGLLVLSEARLAVYQTALGSCALVQICLKSVVLFPFHCCMVVSVKPISRLITKLTVMLPLLLILRITYLVIRGHASSSLFKSSPALWEILPVQSLGELGVLRRVEYHVTFLCTVKRKFKSEGPQ